MSTFNQAFDSIDNSVAFDTKWKNGTGYLDGAVLAKVDKPSTFEDDLGRRGIILPVVQLGKNIVLFQRYSGRSDVIVSNCPSGMEPSCLQQNCASKVADVVKAVWHLNEAASSAMCDVIERAMKASWATVVQVAYLTVVHGRGDAMRAELPMDIALALHAKGQIHSVVSRDGETAPVLGEDGKLQAVGWDEGKLIEYCPLIGHEVVIANMENTLKTIFNTLAA